LLTRAVQKGHGHSLQNGIYGPFDKCIAIELITSLARMVRAELHPDEKKAGERGAGGGRIAYEFDGIASRRIDRYHARCAGHKGKSRQQESGAGKMARGDRRFRKLKNLYSVGYLEGVGHAWAASGHRAEAEAILAQLRELSSKEYVSPTAFAEIYTALGQHRVALGWLERAYRERDAGMVGLAVDSNFDDLRSDPRFKNLLRLVGLP
jgi:hypothetical protein